MMYSQKFVTVLKVGGRILREFNNDGPESCVLLPFGAHYSILVKNLESRPARLKVWVDGEDVLSGNGIIIPAGQEHELCGFMNSGGKVTNRFKFIQKTEQIADHRGDRIDDGILRIEWQYEKPQPVKIDIYETHHHWDHVHHYPKPYWNPGWRGWPNPYWTWTRPLYGSSTGSATDSVTSSSSFHTGGLVNCSNTSGLVGERGAEAIMSTSPAPDEGITVKGQELDHQYRTGYIGVLEPNKHTMIIRLKGTAVVAGEKVVAPVEVKTKVQCTTCGIMTKSGMKYCSNCGTNIVCV
jgi:hypothetical protein